MTRNVTRGPFDGVLNIVRFNWPLFAVTLAAVLALLIGVACTNELARARLAASELKALANTSADARPGA